ncbi:MAG: hypothetical protein GXY13_10670 [Acidimicrobiales bacterium]|nr:hypothetical protein [Acidimicrobiales bacterium]
MDLDAFDNPIEKAIARQLRGYDEFFFDAWVNLAINQITGDYAEFGSWGGNTLNRAYRQQAGFGPPRHHWCYDSFEGLPETDDPRDEHPGWASRSLGQGGVEAFHADCDAHGIPRDVYTAVPGYYSETLAPAAPDAAPADIALAYVDCNLYTSAVTVLEFLRPRLKHGMILAFDDWYCWTSERVSGEREALEEFKATAPEWHFEWYRNVQRAGIAFVVEHAR